MWTLNKHYLCEIKKLPKGEVFFSLNCTYNWRLFWNLSCFPCNLETQSQENMFFGVLVLLSCLRGCKMFIYMYNEWTAAKYTGQKSRLQWRKALSQSVSLKHLRESPECWNHQIGHLLCPGRREECIALPSSRSPSLNTLPCSYYYPFFTSNCSVMVIVRSSPWRNYLQLT